MDYHHHEGQLNRHGVSGYWSHTGTMYGPIVEGRVQAATPVFVPSCCRECAHLEQEYGDFGTLLAGPVCTVGVYLPTRKGTCQRRAG